MYLFLFHCTGRTIDHLVKRWTPNFKNAYISHLYFHSNDIIHFFISLFYTYQNYSLLSEVHCLSIVLILFGLNCARQISKKPDAINIACTNKQKPHIKNAVESYVLLSEKQGKRIRRSRNLSGAITFTIIILLKSTFGTVVKNQLTTNLLGTLMGTRIYRLNTVIIKISIEVKQRTRSFAINTSILTQRKIVGRK